MSYMPNKTLIQPGTFYTLLCCTRELGGICVFLIALSDEASIQMSCSFMHSARSRSNSGPLSILVKMSDRLSLVGM